MSLTISIVTPSLNQGNFLAETIQSVLCQISDQVEYLVIDAGSTDNSLDLLRRNFSSLKWVSEPDRGQADAINKGFRMARGDILGWLNADDLLCPGALQEVAHQFTEDQHLMLLYGNAHHVDEHGHFLEAYPSADFQLERFSYQCFICQPACFFRRSLLEAAGFLDPELHFALDLDLWIRFGKLKPQHPEWKFKHIPQVLALSRMHTRNKTLFKRNEALREIVTVVRRHFRFVPFNWIYALEETAGGCYDGFFQRSPFRISLLVKSISKWIWINRSRSDLIVRDFCRRLRSPLHSYKSLRGRTGERL